MKSNLNVYYSFPPFLTNPGRDLLCFEPVSLISHLKDQNHSIAGAFTDYLQCPAATNLYKNTFAIKSNHDIELKIDHKNDTISLITPKHPLPEIIFTERNAFYNQFDLLDYIIFFSENSLEMSLLNPIYEDTPSTKDLIIFEGKYDISNWFRTISPTLMYKNNHIKIKRGDVLYYIKFHTDKKVKLNQFHMSEKATKILDECTWVKNWRKKLSLTTLYKLFLTRKYNKTLIKEIKSNLL